MEFFNFETIVSRLVKPGSVILEEIDPLKMNIVHAAVGVAGESSEVQKEMRELNGDNSKLIIELGDVEFYFEALLQGFGFEFSNACNPDTSEYQNNLPEKACVLLEPIKKWAINNKELNTTEVQMAILDVRCTLDAIYRSYCIEREWAIQENIKKLSKRYAGLVYSDKAAKERMDER